MTLLEKMFFAYLVLRWIEFVWRIVDAERFWARYHALKELRSRPFVKR